MEYKCGMFYGVGVGPGDPELLTIKAMQVIKSVDIIYEAVSAEGKDSVAGHIIEKACPNIKRVPLLFPMIRDFSLKEKKWKENAKIIEEQLRKGKDCAFITLGDPLIYSTCSYLLGELKKLFTSLECEIIPGITSFQTAAAKLQSPLVEDKQILAIVPAYTKEILEKASIVTSDTLVVMKAFRSMKSILNLVESSKDISGIYARKLCLEDELITDDMQLVNNLKEEYLSLFIIKKQSKNKS